MADIDHRELTTGVVVNNTNSDAQDKIAIYGSKYDDTIRNDGVNVTIDGGNGNDIIFSNGEGGKGSFALIDAGAGKDTIYIGNLNTVSGGIESDLFIYNVGAGNATITDYSAYQDNDIIKVDGNAEAFSGLVNSGDDYIVKVGSYDLTLKDAKRNAASLRFRLNDYDSITSAVSDLSMDASERTAIITTSGDRVTINGSGESDTINASGVNNIIKAGDGANSIISSGKDASIVSGDGSDTISISGSGATVSPGAGDDAVTLASNNLYQYTSGSDVIYSYNDTDTIQVNNALDVFDASKVTIAADRSATANALLTIDSTTITIVGGTKKRINVLNSTGTAMTGFIVKSTQDSDTSVVKYNIDNAVVDGSDGNDYVVNSKDGAALALGAGNDTYELVAHNTAIQYESGQDIVLGFDSTDKVSLSYVTPPFIGGKVSGNDIIIYANQDGIDSDTDIITLKDVKTQTVNVIRGDTRVSDQVLTALNGNITLHGIGSNDVFYYRAGSGNQTIVGYDGNDSILTSTDTTVTNAAIKSNNVILAIGSSSLTVKDGASNRLNIVGYGSQIYGDKSIEVENGDGDIVNATLNASVVTIDGATARSTSVQLIGNKNNNKILGVTNACSTLHGGTGNDTLTGGEKADRFIYSAGKDVITDYFGSVGDLSSTVDAKRYETDTDVIQLSTGSISTYSISGQDVVFTIDSDKNKTLTVKDGKNKKITFLNAAGDIDTGTTKVYRSATEFIVTADDIDSLKSTQSITTTGSSADPVTVTVTAADSKVTLIDANLELDNSSGTSLKYNNLYISGYKDTANSLKASRYGNDTLAGSTKADTLFGSGEVIVTVKGADNKDVTIDAAGADTFLYKYGMGKDVIVNYKEADKIFFTSTDTTLTGSTLKSGNITFTVTDLKGKNKSTFVVRDVAGKKITFANNTDTALYSQVFGTNAITVGDEDLDTVNTKPNTAVKNIDASTRTKDIYILGNAKANSIKGGTGEVTLQGGAGKDTLTRGDNSHTTFAFGSNEGTANVVTSYIAGSDTIKVLSGALTATATIKNSNDLTFTIGKTKVRVKDAKGKAITVVDANDTSTTQIYGLASISVADKDADVGAIVNTAANSTVVTIDAAERTNSVYLVGNKKANVIVAGKGNETIATAAGKDTVQINAFKNSQQFFITDYASGNDKIELASGVAITAASTLKAGGKIGNTNDTVAADSIILELSSGTTKSTLVVEGAITTSKKGKVTHGKLTIVDDTQGITYSQAYGAKEIAVANADGATVDTNGNTTATIINAKKRTSKAVILGNENVNSIIGGTKADTIYAGINGATIDAAAGNDMIFGVVSDTTKIVSVNGGKGNDTVVAGAGNNIVFTGTGNDVIYLSADKNQLKSGSNTTNLGTDKINDYAAGKDKLYLENGTYLVNSTVKGGTLTLTLGFGSGEGSGTKVVELSNTENKKITITDEATGLTTKQAYGVASIAMANGDAETVDGSLSYNSALKIINAKKVTKKALYLVGNSNDGSKIIGGSKADTIQSGSGDTTMTGGKGDDVFIYGGGNDTITDYSIVNKNNDYLKFETTVGNPTYYHVEGKNVVLEFAGDKNTLTIVNSKDKKFNFKDWTPTFGTLDKTFDGTFDDYTQLVLTKKKSQGEAKKGSNSLDYRTTYIDASKNSSAITIWGNDSDSTIIASAKADNIIGGSEDDLITTGKGKDTISLSGGNDTITDYATGSDVLHLNDFTLKSAKVNGDAIVFTTEKSGTEYQLRVGGAVNKKGTAQKITVYDGTRTTSQVYGATAITIGDSDGDVFNLSTDVNSNVTKADASKRKASKSIRIISGSKNTELIGGAGGDTLIGGSGGGILTGGAGDDSLVGDKGVTTFNPGKGDDHIRISTAEGRGKATITYTAGGDHIYNYKSTDSINLASSKVKATTAKVNGNTCSINFNNGGSVDISLASGETASNVFTIRKDTTATKVSGSKDKKGGSGSDSGTTVYDWKVNYYLNVKGFNGVSSALYSTTTVTKVANASDAVSAAPTLSLSNYEEHYEDYEQLFADDVLARADDLSEITSSSVDRAAIAVDLTSTSNLTDFKVDTESLTTLTQNDKVKK